MSAKEWAIQDMLPELRKSNKCFLAFKKELNPVMRKLVSKQIQAQMVLNPFKSPSHSNSQLVAHCFFSKSSGEVNYSDYSKYYKKK